MSQELETIFKDSKENISGPLLQYFQELKASNALVNLNISMEKSPFGFTNRKFLNSFQHHSHEALKVQIDFTVTKVIVPPAEIADFFSWEDQITFGSSENELRGKFIFEQNIQLEDFK